MRKRIMIILLTITTLCGGCSNRDAALFGGLIGRTLGKPVGTVATALDETFKTAGDISKENPRYQQQGEYQPTKPAARLDNGNDYYYRTEVLIKTRGPAQIEEINLQDSEDVSEFWR